jgi:exodeoxyribonuclease VII large subunit
MEETADGSTGRAPTREVYSVARLNREARALLEGGLPALWVEGEISNLSRPASGHLYFTLKDSEAQVGCAFFRNRNQFIGCRPENGMQVLARARVSLYEARGQYQLIVEHLEEAGDGVLRRAFEQLKLRLDAEGLFAEAVKRVPPALPRRVGVITSPTGAALRDILTTLERRFPAVPVQIYPVPVQGAEAAPRIVAALDLAGRRGDCDVLILARGGGSLEDLQAFNGETVARAIRICPIPVVCGVGHETDFTIADFAADVRAATPTAAAMRAVPDHNEWLARVSEQRRRLAGALCTRLTGHSLRLGGLLRRLNVQEPAFRVRQRMQRLDELDGRLHRALRAALGQRGARLDTLDAGLARHHPRQQFAAHGIHLAHLAARLQAGLNARLSDHRQRLGLAARSLDAVSPLATLDRGYAIVTRGRDGAVLRDASRVAVGDAVDARLARGLLRCRVEAAEEGN